jgi:sensor histidine kinase YesM
MDFYLPALTLQPIAENAVRYGVTKKEHGGTVTITAEEADGNAVITVIDDGVGFDQPSAQPPQDGRSHVGIENVRSRLAALCGGTLEIRSKSGDGTTAVITIPKKGSIA